MFDTTCAIEGKWKARAFEDRSAPLPMLDGNCSVGAITWEEHCVECGQPECFKSCKMYERSFDGKCRRFESGIVPFRSCGRLLHGCTFRKWSKLEGVFSGRFITAASAARWAAIDRTLSKIAQLINRAMAFIPGRIGAITVYRRLKRWSSNALGGKCSATAGGLVMRCRSSRPVKLHFSIIDGNKSVHDEVFSLNGDWQAISTAFKPIGKGARCLLFAIEEDPFDLVFETLELLEQPLAMASDAPVRSSAPKAPAKFVKCVAWDLDNTLWKGILVEDGVDKLVLNDEAVKLIKELDRRGIVHTILSKNDYAPAWKALERFGLAEYFVFPHINWLPKSGNLQAVAKEINIGLDTFAFIDDSAFERGEVGERCPMARVFDETQIGELASRPEFNPPISAESAGRRSSYQKEMQRVAAAQEFDGDYASFLRSCEIMLSLIPLGGASSAIYDRCYELIQRTNQLTLAGRRYSPDEFVNLLAPAEVEAWAIKCQDKYGDYGIVGVVVCRQTDKEMSILEFVMSCRVAKKQCEYAVLHSLALRAKLSGRRSFHATVVKTGRNTALVEAFDEMPFRKSAGVDATAVEYSANLQSVRFPVPINKVEYL